MYKRQDQSTGRGTGNSGDYLQLSLFPTEEEQLGEIRKAAAALEQPAAFLISDEVVDDILRTGSAVSYTHLDVYKRQVFGVYSDEACTKLITQMPATDKNGKSSVTIIKTQDISTWGVRSQG